VTTTIPLVQATNAPRLLLPRLCRFFFNVWRSTQDLIVKRNLTERSLCLPQGVVSSSDNRATSLTKWIQQMARKRPKNLLGGSSKMVSDKWTCKANLCFYRVPLSSQTVGNVHGPRAQRVSRQTHVGQNSSHKCPHKHELALYSLYPRVIATAVGSYARRSYTIWTEECIINAQNTVI